MKHISIICILSCIASLFSVIDCQRVAPGVPPQHYQPNQQHHQQQQYQQPPPPQYQQQQHHQQQQQQHQPPPNVNPQHYNQQVPVQQVDHNGQFVDQHQQQQQHHQQQQQHQPQHPQHPPQAPSQHQQPQGGGHHHDHHGGPQQVLNAANIQHEAQHIAEHMEVPIDTSKMTDQELQFHYFKMHDADNNNKLDGCELIKSLIHWHGPDGVGGGMVYNKDKNGEKEMEDSYTDEQITSSIDVVLGMMDSDNDGYISYIEYKQSGVEENRKSDFPDPA